MSEAAVLTSLDNGVLTLTLNRPAQRNAMNQALVTQLRAALAAAGTDDAARVVILRGAGGNFCAGADIAEMAQARTLPIGQGRDPLAVLNEGFGELCLAVVNCPRPVVAVAQGAVIGGGFGLACAADLTLGTPDTRMRLSETTLGLIPAQIAPFLVARLGHARSNRLALTAATITGAQALELGLIHELCDAQETLDEAIEGAAMTFKKSAPGALAATKALLRRALFEPPEALIAHAADIFAAAARGPEGMEGMMAFLEKRSPSWAS